MGNATLTGQGSPELDGPVQAIRSGIGIFWRGRGLMIGEVLLIGLTMIIGMAVLRVIGVFPPPAGPMAPGSMMLWSSFTWSGLLGEFGFGIGILFLEIGMMRSLTNLADGRPAGLRDLVWAFRRGEVWLLVIAWQVVALGLDGLFVGALMEGGLRATGQPQHPFMWIHGGFVPPLLLAVVAAAILIISNTVGLAIAGAARFELSAFNALRLGLRSFRAGNRRYLLMVPLLILAGTGVGLTLGFVVGLVVFSMKAFGALPLTRVLGAIFMILVMIVSILLIISFGIVMMAAFVVASGALKD
ncbi:MAG: hypothetical protein ACYDEV_02175 [Acidiferrobacter sp.]